MISASHMRKACTALLTMLVLNSAAYATDPTGTISPESIEGTTRISAEALITLAGEKPNLVIIDSRVTANRKHGYIEGSISLPNTDTSCESLEVVIPEKSTPAAFYCNGVKCGRSAKAIKIAVDCGYSNLYWFRGGFEEWKEKSFPYLHAE